MKSAVYATQAAAIAICKAIDAKLGYPKTEQGEIGPPVFTQTWTAPIALADGTFAVEMTDAIAALVNVAGPNLANRDLLALKAPDPVTP